MADLLRPLRMCPIEVQMRDGLRRCDLPFSHEGDHFAAWTDRDGFEHCHTWRKR